VARNIDRRLNSLKSRRIGLDRLGRLNLQEQNAVWLRSVLDESYQKRAPNQPYTRYALGSMQEVGPDYTRISIETAERVMKQLDKRLTAVGRNIRYRLQGSVPANLHIRGVSDVDMLSLDEAFHTYEPTGLRAQRGAYHGPLGYTPISALLTMRAGIERILRTEFPKAEVDASGGKAVKISGGSLPRAVDVVPSHWHDTTDYQLTQSEVDRGVMILDKKASTTPLNMPFLHIDRITSRDNEALFGLKKAIRLCKNIKSDAEDDGTQIQLPSFDLASTMYHADRAALRLGAGYELAILAETQRYLDLLSRNIQYAVTLSVPDGSRRIFDTAEKLRGLQALSKELDDLLFEVANEQFANLRLGRKLTLPEIRDAVSKVYMAAA
jgi:hypothetical protein